MKHNNDFKSEAIRRISIAQGHLEKVRKMLEEDAYCPDIIHQSQAVQAALKKADQVVLHGHLHTCVFNDIHGPRSKREKVINEIVDLFKKDNGRIKI